MVVSEKYDELIELLINDISLVMVMSVVCLSYDMDELIILLLNIFEMRGFIFVLFEVFIK